MFDNIREDWQTYDRDITRQGLWVMLVYRFGRWRYTVTPLALRRPFSLLYRVLKLASQILTGIDFPCEVEVGRRFRIDHFGGIIISGDARFGDDCTIRNGVTIGLRRAGERGAPSFGNRVDIGAGAVILGPISIGDDVNIGANAVVLCDVPSNSVAVGVPAQIRPKRSAIYRALTAMIVCVALAASVKGQSADTPAAPEDFQLVDKTRVDSPAALIREFEAPVLETYTIDDGDELTIEVWGRPELSCHQTVGPDGSITLPLAGTFHIAGRSRDDAQQAIARAYARYYSDLNVTVRVDRYSSYRVFVLGRVGSPGPLVFERQPTLLDVLARAAGLPIGAGADKAGLVRCAVFRRDRLIWIDLLKLLGRGNLDLNIRLSRNDLVYLPDVDDRLVYVLGAVKNTGPFRLTPTMSFVEAVAAAGGATEDAATQHIAIIRTTKGTKQEVSLDRLTAGDREVNYALEDGDVIYVPRRGIARIGYVLQKISPLTAFSVFATAVTR